MTFVGCDIKFYCQDSFRTSLLDVTSKYSNISHYKYTSQRNLVQIKFQDPSNLHVKHQETNPYQN